LTKEEKVKINKIIRIRKIELKEMLERRKRDDHWEPLLSNNFFKGAAQYLVNRYPSIP